MQKAAILLAGIVIGVLGTVWLESRFELGGPGLQPAFDEPRGTTANPALPARGETPISPDQALRDALALTGPERGPTTRIAASTLALTDPAGAVRQLTALPDRRERIELTVIALGTWAIHAPRDALFAIDDLLRGGFEFDGNQRQLAEQIGRQAPLVMLDSYAALSPALAEPGAEAATMVLAETGPELALSYLGDALSEDERARRTDALVRGWARLDPYAALTWVKSQSEFPNREREASVFRELASADAVGALEFALADAANIRSQRSTLTEVMRVALTTGDPDLADELMQTALAETAPDEAQFALVPMFEIWMAEDPSSSFEWLARNARRVPEMALTGIAGQIRSSGTRAAQAAALSNRIPETARTGWIEQIGAAYAEQSPAASMDWTDSLRGTPDHRTAVLAVANLLSRSNPADTIALLDRAGLPIEDERQALQQAANRWSRNDPEGLREWAMRLTDPERQTAVAGSIATAWGAIDPEAAADWVMQLPASGQRDEALGNVVLASVESQVQQGLPIAPDMELIDSFGSDLMREALLMAVTEQISRTDPAAALQFADEHLTDPSLRQMIEDNIARREQR